MCLEVLKEKFEVKISKTPIVCYKRGVYNKTTKKLISPYRHRFYYKRGEPTKVVELGIIEKDYWDKKEVYEGYHSCIYFWDWMSKEVFIIPKGSEYIKGGINNKNVVNGYVSNQIIWIGNKWNPLTWLKVLSYFK